MQIDCNKRTIRRLIVTRLVFRKTNISVSSPSITSLVRPSCDLSARFGTDMFNRFYNPPIRISAFFTFGTVTQETRRGRCRSLWANRIRPASVNPSTLRLITNSSWKSSSKSITRQVFPWVNCFIFCFVLSKLPNRSHQKEFAARVMRFTRPMRDTLVFSCVGLYPQQCRKTSERIS